MKSEIEYKQLFELSPEAIVVLDKKGVVIELNGRLLDWLGYDLEEVKGKSFMQVPFLTKKAKVLAAKNFANRMLGKKIEPYDLDFVSKNGEEKVGRIFASLINDKQGNALDLILILDVTKEKRAEEDLKKYINETIERQNILAESAVMLSTSSDFHKMVQKTLKLLGELVGASRVYIFEDSKDGKTTSNTFEWVDKGVTPQTDNLQDIPYDQIPSWKKILHREGEINTHDITKLPKDLVEILKPQDIQALLVFPITVGGKDFGFVGFDEVKTKKVWSEEEVALLKTISKIISNVFEKRFVEDALREKVSELEKINKLMTDRELRMVELKKEIQDLKGDN